MNGKQIVCDSKVDSKMKQKIIYHSILLGTKVSETQPKRTANASDQFVVTSLMLSLRARNMGLNV